MKPEKKIAISVSSGRIQEGVFRFVEKHPEWAVYTSDWCERSVCNALENWNNEGDGLIIEARNEEVKKTLSKYTIPYVVVSDTPSSAPSWVYHDDELTGRMVAEHLLEKGLQEYVFFGWMRHSFARMRFKGFSDRLAEVGKKAILFDGQELDNVQNRFYHHLGEHLESYTRPFGFFCAYDYLAQISIQAARMRGIQIPDDLCIVGVDNNCEHYTVSITSVDPDYEGVGFIAANHLHQLINGKKTPKQYLVPPLKLHVRASSDKNTSSESVIASAYQFIQNHPERLVTVEELSKALDMSRRNLYYLFDKHLKRTPMDEIVRVHLDKARDLLRTTNDSIRDIAKESGFSSAKHLWKHLVKVTGMTPTEYRKNSRKA